MAKSKLFPDEIWVTRDEEEGVEKVTYFGHEKLADHNIDDVGETVAVYKLMRAHKARRVIEVK